MISACFSYGIQLKLNTIYELLMQHQIIFAKKHFFLHNQKNNLAHKAQSGYLNYKIIKTDLADHSIWSIRQPSIVVNPATIT